MNFFILDSIEFIIIITDKIGKICISETMILFYVIREGINQFYGCSCTISSQYISSNKAWYCIKYNCEKDRSLFTLWTHKSHPYISLLSEILGVCSNFIGLKMAARFAQEFHDSDQKRVLGYTFVYSVIGHWHKISISNAKLDNLHINFAVTLTLFLLLLVIVWLSNYIT